MYLKLDAGLIVIWWVNVVSKWFIWVAGFLYLFMLLMYEAISFCKFLSAAPEFIFMTQLERYDDFFARFIFSFAFKINSKRRLNFKTFVGQVVKQLKKCW